MAAPQKLKYYYGKELAELLAQKITKAFPAFDDQGFVDKVALQVDDLELKARIEAITDSLHDFLPQDYPSAISTLLKILGPENEKETGMFKEFYWLSPVAFFVEKYGVNYFQPSVDAIYEITKRNTGEAAVRPFLEKYPDKMLAIMIQWSKDPNFHIRRLASEGVRPRLPWSKRLDRFITKPQLILPLLENLKEDPSKFVQKSVANCLNDILKDNHDTAMEVLTAWSKSDHPSTRWIVKHALRNKRKKGDPVALSLVKG